MSDGSPLSLVRAERQQRTHKGPLIFISWSAVVVGRWGVLSTGQKKKGPAITPSNPLNAACILYAVTHLRTVLAW